MVVHGHMPKVRKAKKGGDVVTENSPAIEFINTNSPAVALIKADPEFQSHTADEFITDDPVQSDDTDDPSCDLFIKPDPVQQHSDPAGDPASDLFIIADPIHQDSATGDPVRIENADPAGDLFIKADPIQQYSTTGDPVRIETDDHSDADHVQRIALDPAVETITCDHLDDLDPGVRHDSTDIAE
jgi:hypothetical protein